jgi:rhodanese-related sulfurtransferase
VTSAYPRLSLALWSTLLCRLSHLLSKRWQYADYGGHLPLAVSYPLSGLFQASHELRKQAKLARNLREHGVQDGSQVVVYSAEGIDSAFATAVLKWAGFDAVNYVGARRRCLLRCSTCVYGCACAGQGCNWSGLAWGLCASTGCSALHAAARVHDRCQLCRWLARLEFARVAAAQRRFAAPDCCDCACC